MKKTGLTLITLSFLVGAYLSVLDEFTVPWSYFIVVLVAGFAGVALARIGSRAASTSSEALEANFSTVRTSLDNIVEKVGELHAQRETIPTYDMSKEIDRRVLDDLNDFVEAREAISHVFGLQAYAGVMSHYAGGERYLNRVWSASADGYIDEVNDYIGRALEQFTIARDKLASMGGAEAGRTDPASETRAR